MANHEHCQERDRVITTFENSKYAAEQVIDLLSRRGVVRRKDWKLVDLYLEAETPVMSWGIYGQEVTEAEKHDAPLGDAVLYEDYPDQPEEWDSFR